MDRYDKLLFILLGVLLLVLVFTVAAQAKTYNCVQPEPKAGIQAVQAGLIQFSEGSPISPIAMSWAHAYLNSGTPNQRTAGAALWYAVNGDAGPLEKRLALERADHNNGEILADYMDVYWSGYLVAYYASAMRGQTHLNGEIRRWMREELALWRLHSFHGRIYAPGLRTETGNPPTRDVLYAYLSGKPSPKGDNWREQPWQCYAVTYGASQLIYRRLHWAAPEVILPSPPKTYRGALKTLGHIHLRYTITWFRTTHGWASFFSSEQRAWNHPTTAVSVVNGKLHVMDWIDEGHYVYGQHLQPAKLHDGMLTATMTISEGYPDRGDHHVVWHTYTKSIPVPDGNVIQAYTIGPHGLHTTTIELTPPIEQDPVQIFDIPIRILTRRW